MQIAHQKLTPLFERAPNLLLPMRWWVIAVFVLLTVFMTLGIASRFSLDMALESWFQDDDPAKRSLDAFRAQFGSDDGIYIVYRPSDGDVFSIESIALLSEFHQALDDARIQPRESTELARLERIDSLINVRYQIADADQLISRQLVGSQVPTDTESAEAIRALALTQSQLPLAFFSDDFQYGGIRLKTDFGTIPLGEHLPNADVSDDILDADDLEWELAHDPLDVDESAVLAPAEYEDTQMEEYLAFMTDLRAISESEQFSGFQFFYTGNAPMMEFAMQSMGQAVKLLAAMVVIVFGLLWFLFRSLSAVVWPLIVIIASNLWTIGIVSWFGVELSNMVSLSFMLILAVGIADCVHVMSTYLFHRGHGLAHRICLAKAYRKTGIPILLTTVTTMAGMFALSFSDIPQIGVFGLTSALGVLMAFIFTVLLLPVLLDVWHPRVKRKEIGEPMEELNRHHWLQPLLDRLPGFVGRRPRLIVAFYGIIFLGFVYGTSIIKVDSNFAELTREGSEIRITYDIVDAFMMGGNNMEIMMDFGESDALKSTQTLKAIAQLQETIESKYPEYVVKTFSIADFVKDTHRVMQEGRDDYYSIPDSDHLTAQLLYLFDNANAKDRRQLVSDDYSQTHLSVQIRNAGSYEYANFFEQVDADIQQLLGPLGEQYPSMKVNITGSLALMMVLIDHMSWAQLKSFSIALVIISCLMVVALGSLQGGLLAMIPNMLPAIFTFGVMGLLGIPLDTDTLIIAPLIIGIAVDDTIHFMAHYRAAWYECGDVDKALKSTIKEVGQAVTFTSLILGVGFFVLSFSSYLGIAKTGIFGSMAIFVALSSDLLLLPALIKWLKPSLGRPESIPITESITASASRTSAP